MRGEVILIALFLVASISSGFLYIYYTNAQSEISRLQSLLGQHQERRLSEEIKEKRYKKVIKDLEAENDVIKKHNFRTTEESNKSIEDLRADSKILEQKLRESEALCTCTEQISVLESEKKSLTDAIGMLEDQISKNSNSNTIPQPTCNCDSFQDELNSKKKMLDTITSQYTKIETFLKSKLDAYRKDPKLKPSPVSPILTSSKYTIEDIIFSVITAPLHHENRAIAVKETWAKRAHKVLYISSEEEPGLPTVAFPGTDKDGSLATYKVFASFHHLHDNYLDQYKWFMKLDDDTYPIIEHILSALDNYDHNVPLFLGRIGYSPNGAFCSGGAGYILSQAALKKLKPFINDCEKDGPEDMKVAECLESFMELQPTSLSGMYAWTPSFHIATDSYSFDSLPLSFHSIYVNDMLDMDFLLYNARYKKL